MRRHVLTISIGTLLVALVALARLFVWPPSDTLDHVDAIVVLGGGEAARLEMGLALFADRAGDTLVLSAEAAHAAADRGMSCVDEDVICVDPRPRNTAGEARTISAVAADRGWSSMAVVTSTYHLTRARVLFDQCFDGRLAMVEAAVPRARRSFLRNAVQEVPGLVGGITFARAC